MEVNTYKSLYKPLLWGGINREHFILIFLSAIASIMLFKTFRAIFSNHCYLHYPSYY